MSRSIYHITARSAWSAAQQAGSYTAGSLASQGFIHCSKITQVLRVAAAFYSDQNGLVLLEIDTAGLKAEVRWEPGTDKPDELFPHLYGPLNLEAVVGVYDFDPEADGSFHLPETLGRHA